VINYYEPRLPENDDASLKKLHDCIDDAARFCRTINFFMHPHYITGLYGSNIPVLSAIDEALSYGNKNNYKIIKYGPDKLCLWWHDRAASFISGSGSKFTVNAAAGVIIRIPCRSDAQSPQIIINGQNAKYVKKNIDGLDWLMLTAAKGYSEIEIL
jgi:hypothetical protein